MAQDDKESNKEAGTGDAQPAQVGSSDDLAGGLFGNKNHALANVVRDLHQRNKRTQQQKSALGPPDDDRVPNAAAETAVAVNNGDVEIGNASGLWVVGGASTVFSKGATRLDGVPVVKAAPDVPKPDGATVSPEPPDGPIPATDFDAKTEPAAATAATEPPRQPSKLGSCCSSTYDVFRELAGIVRLYPSTLLIPLLVFLLLAGLGVWGVMAGAAAHVKQQKDDARSRAVDAATGFQIQLQQSFTPGVTFQLLVKQRPEWEYWLQNFNQTAQELLTRVPKGSLWNLQLQPFAQVMMIHPFRPEDDGQINPPRDLVGDPTRRDGILGSIRSRQPTVNGPFKLVQGFLGAFVRYPIYVPDVDAEETFGFRYRENATAIPYSQLPASVRNCSVCYNATSREKWWGILTVLVNYDEVTHGNDAYLANLRKMDLDYELVHPINATYEDVIYRTEGTAPLRDADSVTVDVKVINGVWLLRVAPKSGFEPAWKGPLIAAVIIITFIISVLLFVSLASFKRQVLLLNETVAANHKLAETTEQLQAEKERMDVLLIRQYELLKCLDSNRAKRLDDDSSLAGASRRAMMARIEDARRSLNVAKASVEDPIQVFEVLGAGAFGKVQRGLWRGTVVAVKTMILPANMTGQEKREKMAVMEAAISSSLVHPNIVTTYTYFIRPYHEPTHDGVQQMPSSQYTGTSLSARSNGSDPQSMDRSVVSEATIHSYEVRLVLEFCDKGSLKDALDQHAFMQGEGFNLAAMLETASDVAKAMVHMHAANVLHSDLKARNIMLKSSGTEGRGVIAKVADFGLSTRMEHTETHLSSCFQGTLTHMAPEVMLEGRISKAADVYSFGILMWELFCAGDPFSGVPRAHLGHAITKQCLRPKFPPFAPREYVDLAARCWDPDAAARPTFEQVLSELVRMREELGGGATQTLQIAPPPPITTQPAAAGGNTGGGGGASGTAAGSAFGASGVIARDNPLALYNAGIVVGGASTTMASVMNSSGGGGGDGGGGGPPMALHSPSKPPGPGSSQLSSSSSSVSGLQHQPHHHHLNLQRAMIKSSLAQRHLRRLGIRLGSVGGSGNGSMAPTLSALDEEEGEHKEGSGSGSA
ncbi:hypothetical protein PLESTB_000202400 [Pleodorina starrii]|uniref:Protein kinase domain-containing protein n=1 Tax=Pleodorina starrii TaxID=330485 RepID=A0A9W6BBU2_9CHLO|nr:hypothetical protein PLESTB_000202400 [Pleodorina starrii]GLC73458.1 hypothetical protein PLESTF_001377900 [Pleodorina starrii]